MSFLINPYAFLAADGDYESIATVTVGSGGAANIEFTSIPGTYQHLQVRMIARTDASLASGGSVNIRLNGDTGSNYGYHALWGEGTTAYGDGLQSLTSIYQNRLASASQTASVFSGYIVDILDYASTSKNTTTRALSGFDANGSGRVYVLSGLWLSTSAVSTLLLTPSSGSFVQHSTAALYGIKAP